MKEKETRSIWEQIGRKTVPSTSKEMRVERPKKKKEDEKKEKSIAEQINFGGKYR